VARGRLRLDLRADELGDAAYTDIRDPEVFTRVRIREIEAHIAGELGLPPHLGTNKLRNCCGKPYAPCDHT
jgi:hypothetical protein